MRRILFLSALSLLPSIVAAQETYSCQLNTAIGVTAFDRSRIAWNTDVCRGLSIPVATCTQALVCVAANVQGGASCTTAQAAAANVPLFPGTFAGRQAYAEHRLRRIAIEDIANRVKPAERKAYCEWWSAQNQTTRDSECNAKFGGAPCDGGCP